MADDDENPFVGPRPYERADEGRFFGRDIEIRRLLSLVVAHRVVLLYAASGAGKSSLVNAGLVPCLEAEEDFEVLPVARVGGPARGDPGENVFVAGLLAGWEAGRSGADGLVEYLSRRPRSTGADGFSAPRAIVVDQFEELFTLHPDRWEEREGFIRQLAEALDKQQPLRVLLSIREDYIAQLDPYAHLLPDRLGVRFRLERLGERQAERAVTKPLDGTGRSISGAAAKALVGDLLKTRVELPGVGVKEVRGEYVEPVQLQVACQSLWDELPADVAEIQEEHLRTFGDVDEVLARFYDEAIAAAAAKAHARELRLRGRFESEFITRAGTRGTLTADMAKARGVPPAAIEELERRHLVRAEMRAGARWFELTHDRFIEPIRASNRRASDARRRRRLRMVAAAVPVGAIAAAAITLGLSDEPAVPKASSAAIPQRVLEQSLQALVGTVRGHPGPVTGVEFSGDGRRLLTTSRTARLSSADTGATLRPLGQSGRVSSAAFDPSGRRVATASQDGTTTIWDAATGRRVLLLGGSGRPVRSVAFSPNGRTILTAGDDGIARTWNPSGTPRFQFEPKIGPLTSAVFSPEGAIAMSGARGAALWRPGRPDVTPLKGHVGPVAGVEFSATGRRLVTFGADGTARVWRVATPDRPPLELPHGAALTAARFRPGPGDRIATAGADGTMRMWSLPDGSPRGRLHIDASPIPALAFSPDGRLLAIAGGDRTARVWDVRRRRQSQILAGHEGPLTSVAFARDSSSLATGSLDRTARIWSIGRRLPDLVIATVEVNEGGELLRVGVSNQGEARSPNTVLRVSGIPGVERGVGFPALAPGQAVGVEIHIPPDAEAGVLSLEVDPGNDIAETSDSNNVADIEYVPKPNVAPPPPPPGVPPPPPPPPGVPPPAPPPPPPPGVPPPPPPPPPPVSNPTPAPTVIGTPTPTTAPEEEGIP